MFFEILPHSIRIGVHDILPGGPVGGTDLAVVGGNELEGLKRPLGLPDGAADGKIVDRGVHDDALGIDEEEAAQGHPGLGKHPEGTGQLPGGEPWISPPGSR